MSCPLCQKRKSKRFCPAKNVLICPVCCGTKREVEIDCPPNCVYLNNGRKYEGERVARTTPPPARTQRLWDDTFQAQFGPWLFALGGVMTSERKRNAEIVDADAIATLEALIQTYRTLEKGIYYAHAPAPVTQRNLYLELKSYLEKASDNPSVGGERLKTSEILNCLQFLKELATALALPRPKCRIFLDHMEGFCNRNARQRKEEPQIILPS